MSWSALPDDMVGVILGNLSLLDFARISRTCSAFHALYRQQLAAVQEALTALAQKSFGQQRIMRIGGVITRFLKREALPVGYVEHNMNIYEISAEGVISRVRGTTHLTGEGPFVTLVIAEPLYYARYHADTLWVHARLRSRLLMRIHRAGWGHAIGIFPENDQDFEGVALAQTLLSGGLAKCIRDSGQCADLSIYPGLDGAATRAGLKSQIATLMPFSSYYMRGGRLFDAFYGFTESMQIGHTYRPVKIMQSGHVGSLADKGTAQGVDNTVIRGSATRALDPVSWEAWMH
jgi:hypothetical protein